MLEYQAEVSKLMDLIVNSLYSNKDVFLRELVSNASDALDKVRFEGVSDPKALEGLADLKIEVKADEEAKTVTIRDTGVGMTRQELLDALGTIANSGTAKFAAALKESQENHDANLIGQFGVGFYSAFLVADRVRVQTKSYKEGEQWVWEGKSGSTTYSVEPDTSGEDLVRGTQITLYVREESHDICSHLKLQELIRQYSNFIEFPIQLWASKSVNRQGEDVEADELLQLEVRADVVRLLPHVQRDLRAPHEVLAAGVWLHGVSGAPGLALPDPLLALLVALCLNPHPVGHEEGRVKADAELTDEVRVVVLLGLLQGGRELGRARVRDRAQRVQQLLARHAHPRVPDGHRLGLLIRLDLDLQVGQAFERLGIGDALEAHLVQRVAGVGHQLPQEHVLVAVQRVDDQVHQLGHLRLVLKRLRLPRRRRRRHGYWSLPVGRA